MVSNASDDLPDPDTPVITVNFSWGMESEMFLRLWTRAPWILIKSSTGILIIRLRQCEPGELSVQRSDAENPETSAEKSNIGRKQRDSPLPRGARVSTTVILGRGFCGYCLHVPPYACRGPPQSRRRQSLGCWPTCRRLGPSRRRPGSRGRRGAGSLARNIRLP